MSLNDLVISHCCFFIAIWFTKRRIKRNPIENELSYWNIQQAVSKNEQHQVVGDLIDSIRNRDTEKYTKHIKLIHELDEYGRKSSKCEALLQKLKSSLSLNAADGHSGESEAVIITLTLKKLFPLCGIH